ncbi:hypothetical protein ACI6PS_12670 [Flavobacterium sp. PLA-1-15]|uniref:hypothetical protein n=1 Tax=Flavobacterium sp. PLA-1-15 TaxID=3380533 RepID=UPI003B7F8444
MGNTIINKINGTITPAQVINVKKALRDINDNLTILVGLTKEERETLLGMDVDNKVFTEDAIQAALNNAEMLPGYVKMDYITNDLELFKQVDEVLPLFVQVTEKLMDTRLLAGSEAFMSGLMLYRLFVSAAQAGVPGADSIVAQLKPRFAGQGGKGANGGEPNPPKA